MAAHDAWVAETNEADAAHEENCELRRRIAMEEASTIAGVMTKARVAGWCWTSSVDMGDDVKSEIKDGTISGRSMLLSLAADLVAMLEAAP